MAAETIIAQFVSEEGEKVGPQVNLPKNISANQLETLLNQFLSNVNLYFKRDVHSFFGFSRIRTKNFHTPSSSMIT